MLFFFAGESLAGPSNKELMCVVENDDADTPRIVYLTLDESNRKVVTSSLENEWTGLQYSDPTLNDIFVYEVEVWSDSKIKIYFNKPNPTYPPNIPEEFRNSYERNGYVSDHKMFGHYGIEIDRYTGKFRIWKRYFSFDTNLNYWHTQTELGRRGGDVSDEIKEAMQYVFSPRPGEGMCSLRGERKF